MREGLFVTFEGGEGAGKTTLIHRLKEKLISEGFETLLTREPGGSALGEAIRHLILFRDPNIAMTPLAELQLFLAARAQHVEELIRPSLEEKKIVLCDRFNDTSVAYQGIARELGQSLVENLCSLVCGKVQPSLTFYLDIDPEEGMRRVHQTLRVLDSMENEGQTFHQKVREGFLKIAQDNPARVKVIDASLPKDVVFEKVWQVISQKLQS